MTAKTLDASDIDRYLGVPMDSSPIREPIANNDIRRWVHAMHYPNRLHYDPAFSAESRWGRLIAPQSFPIAVDEEGRHLVQVKHKMANQKGVTLCTSKAEIQLPKKPD